MAIVAVVIRRLCTFLCCTSECDWQHVKVSFQYNGCKIQLNETLLAHEFASIFLCLLGSKTMRLSQCTTASAVSHTSLHETPGVSHLVSPFCLSLFPPLSLLPFPHPLCIGAKPSNGCWHILEPCCPTRSLSCAGQVRGSARCNLAVDETNAQKQLARPPTIACRAAHLFRSQV